MSVYAGHGVSHEAYPRQSVCDAVRCGCVKRSVDLLRYTKESFRVSVASQNSSPSLHREGLSFVSPAKALAGEEVVELSSPSSVNKSRDTLVYIRGDVDVIHGEPPGAPWSSKAAAAFTGGK